MAHVLTFRWLFWVSAGKNINPMVPMGNGLMAGQPNPLTAQRTPPATLGGVGWPAIMDPKSPHQQIRNEVPKVLLLGPTRTHELKLCMHTLLGFTKNGDDIISWTSGLMGRKSRESHGKKSFQWPRWEVSPLNLDIAGQFPPFFS